MYDLLLYNNMLITVDLCTNKTNKERVGASIHIIHKTTISIDIYFNPKNNIAIQNLQNNKVRYKVIVGGAAGL